MFEILCPENHDRFRKRIVINKLNTSLKYKTEKVVWKSEFPCQYDTTVANIILKPLAIRLTVTFGNKVMIWYKVLLLEGVILYG